MNLLIEYVRSFLLIENRLKKTLAKYKDKFPRNMHAESVVVELSDLDPSGQNKYLDWMVKQFILNKMDYYGVKDIAEPVKFFHDNVQRFKKKDINQYKTLDELQKTVEQIKSKKSKSQQRKDIKSDVDKIYEDEYVAIVHPKTHDSVCLYGAGTKWCITQREESHYDEYSGNNIIFYYILSKVLPSDDPLYKVAAAIIRNEDNSVDDWEMYDAEDNQISPDNFEHLYSERLFDHLKGELVKRAKKEDPFWDPSLIDFDSKYYDFGKDFDKKLDNIREKVHPSNIVKYLDIIENNAPKQPRTAQSYSLKELYEQNGNKLNDVIISKIKSLFGNHSINFGEGGHKISLGGLDDLWHAGVLSEEEYGIISGTDMTLDGVHNIEADHDAISEIIHNLPSDLDDYIKEMAGNPDMDSADIADHLMKNYASEVYSAYYGALENGLVDNVYQQLKNWLFENFDVSMKDTWIEPNAPILTNYISDLSLMEMAKEAEDEIDYDYDNGPDTSWIIDYLQIKSPNVMKKLDQYLSIDEDHFYNVLRDLI